jgi:hypothetical protein
MPEHCGRGLAWVRYFGRTYVRHRAEQTLTGTRQRPICHRPISRGIDRGKNRQRRKLRCDIKADARMERERNVS